MKTNPLHQCQGGTQDVSRQDARHGRRSLRRHWGRVGRLEVYACPWCGWFHLGHNVTRA